MRFLQGLGAAIVLPAALSIVMNMFPEGAERNKALGVWGAIGASGAAVGVMAGGLLTRYVGWQYIFFLNVPIGAAALLLAPRVVPESRLDTARRRYDPFGAVAVTGGLSLLVYAISTAPQVGWGTARTVTLLAVSAALLAAFVVIETRVEAPLMPLRIFQNKTRAGANAVGVLLGGSFFAYIFIGTLYMQQVLGYSALKAGLAWLEMALISVAFAGLSQALVTRGLAKLVMAAGMAMIGGGILWSTQVPVHGHFWASLAGPFFIVGVGTAFAFIPVSIAALAGVAEHEAGLASGLINTSQQLGGAIGIAIASTIAATHASTLLQQGAAPAAALTSGFQLAFWACGAIGLAAVPVTYLLVRRNELATAVARTSQKPNPHPPTFNRTTASYASRESRMPTQELSGTTALATGASRGSAAPSPSPCPSTARTVAGVALDPARLEKLHAQPGGTFTPVGASARSAGPPTSEVSQPRTGGAPPGVRAQLLATEHWSLLATRSMAQSEVLSRITTFLTLVSASIVSLALIGQFTRFDQRFATFALVLLGMLVLIGTLTQMRAGNASIEDLAHVIGMNRLRAAYVELAPGIERYLVTSAHDDDNGLWQTYNRLGGRKPIWQPLASSWMFIAFVNSGLTVCLPRSWRWHLTHLARSPAQQRQRVACPSSAPP